MLSLACPSLPIKAPVKDWVWKHNLLVRNDLLALLHFLFLSADDTKLCSKNQWEQLQSLEGISLLCSCLIGQFHTLLTT